MKSGAIAYPGCCWSSSITTSMTISSSRDTHLGCRRPILRSTGTVLQAPSDTHEDIWRRCRRSSAGDSIHIGDFCLPPIRIEIPASRLHTLRYDDAGGGFPDGQCRIRPSIRSMGAAFTGCPRTRASPRGGSPRSCPCGRRCTCCRPSSRSGGRGTSSRIRRCRIWILRT